jgi:glycosyltransferase involved in cell wall biosynthesis
VKVLAWVPQEFDTSPGQRFRLEQWEPALRRDGIQVTYSPFSDAALAGLLKLRGGLLRKALGVLRAWGRRLREAATLEGFDLVYIFREDALLGPALPARRLAARRIPFVFDFDDSVWLNYRSPANAYLSYLRCPGKTATYCRLARHVLAGNPILSDYAAAQGGRVSVVPTTIDLETYRPPTRPPNNVPVIGWTGSYSTEQHLEVARPALEALAQRYPFRLVVVGGGRFHPAGVAVEHRPWRSCSEVADLADIDVGLMPLPDTPWERGKCGLKALQYMALGVPVVASPVGVNAEIVRHGVDGYLAASSAEWLEALARLLEDAGLRRRMGTAGRSRVESAYSASVHAPRVAHILHEAIA